MNPPLAAAALLAALSFACAAASASDAEGEKAPAGGSRLAVNGKLFTDVYVPYRDAGKTPLRQVSTSLWLQGEARLGETSGARAELAGNRFEKSVSSSSASFETELREGYAYFRQDGLDARVGRQIIPWGKADGVNPTDVLTAKDLAFLNPEEENRRLGATSVQASWTPAQGASPLTLTAVWTPVAPQSRLLIADGVVPSAFTVAATQSPAASLASSETALKATYAASSWDASLMAFRGYNHMPEFALVSIGGPLLSPQFTIAPTFHRQRAVGGDFSRAFESTILRAETAYVWTENNDGSNPTIQPSHWDGVVGAERPFFTDFRVIAQLAWRWFPRHRAADQAGGATAAERAAHRAIAEANALLLNHQDPFRSMATLRVGYNDPSMTWDAEISAVLNFQGQDSLVRPKVSYLWNDSFRTTLGMDRYMGPASRPLGALAAYNSVFAEAKYSF